MKVRLLIALTMTLGLGTALRAEVETEQAAPSCELSADVQAQLDQEFNLLAETGSAPDNYWHCTAFPNGGGGHHHGHDAYSYDYHEAYYRALYDCEHYHHSCHVHCHRD